MKHLSLLFWLFTWQADALWGRSASIENYRVEQSLVVLDEALSVQTNAGEETLSAGERLWQLRRYEQAGQGYVIAYAFSLAENVRIDGASLNRKSHSLPNEQAFSKFFSSALAQPIRSLDGTSERTKKPVTHFAVTIDLCQSMKPWEERFFEGLVAYAKTLGEAIPVGIALSGGWARHHPLELARLRRWEEQGFLAITWINHSFRHPIHSQKFLTAREVNFREEVLLMEQRFLTEGIIFSPFFRFPGLVHNEAVLEDLAQLSLFPIDSNSWLGRHEALQEGGVVLVHGNGNEPLGCALLLQYLKLRQNDLQQHKLQIQSLKVLLRSRS